MRLYEALFIVKPDAPEEEVDGFVDQIKQVITSGNGTVEKADKWGVRKLAYRLQKYNEGIYVLVQFSSSPELVKEIERRFRVTDVVARVFAVNLALAALALATILLPSRTTDIPALSAGSAQVAWLGR